MPTPPSVLSVSDVSFYLYYGYPSSLFFARARARLARVRARFSVVWWSCVVLVGAPLRPRDAERCLRSMRGVTARGLRRLWYLIGA